MESCGVMGGLEVWNSRPIRAPSGFCWGRKIADALRGRRDRQRNLPLIAARSLELDVVMEGQMASRPRKHLYAKRIDAARYKEIY